MRKALIVAAIVLMAGCSIEPEQAEDDVRPAGGEGTSPANAKAYAFGKSAKWGDTVTGTVVGVKPVTTFGAYATEAGPGYRVTLKFTAGSDPVDLTLASVDVRSGPESVSGQEVFGADNCETTFDIGKLSPGKSVTTTLCFTGKGSPVDVAVAPGINLGTNTWTGKPA